MWKWYNENKVIGNILGIILLCFACFLGGYFANSGGSSESVTELRTELLTTRQHLSSVRQTVNYTGQTIYNLNTTISERDATAKEREQYIAEREAYIAEREQYIEEGQSISQELTTAELETKRVIELGRERNRESLIELRQLIKGHSEDGTDD